MGPLIMIHAWVHLSASLQHPLSPGRGSPQDTPSPLTRYRLFAWQEPRPMTPSLPPCLKSLISPPRGGDGSLGPERGSRGSWSDVSGMRVMSDIRMTGWWHMVTAPPQLIGTPRRSPQAAVVGSLATGAGAGHPCAQDHIPSELEMVPGSASFILLSPTPVIPGVIQLVHNHNESHPPQDSEGREIVFVSSEIISRCFLDWKWIN